MIHFDTSYLIRALVRESPQDRQLRAWLATGDELAISSVAWAEFLCGPVDPAIRAVAEQLLPTRASFESTDAEWRRSCSTRPAVVADPLSIA